MSNNIQIKRKVGGTQSAPGGNNLPGELALFFPGNPGDKTKPVLYGNDGGGWREVNPLAAVTVGIAGMAGGASGAKTGIGAAWTTLGGAQPTDPIIIGTFAGTAYVKSGAGGNDADWTPLGSASQFASAADIITGNEAAKAIAPDQLRLSTAVTPDATGTNDANKIPRLGPNGFLDPGFLKITTVKFRGALDLTSAPTGTWNSGDYGLVRTDTAQAAINATWAISADVKAGDMIVYDGANYDLIQHTADMSAYLPLAGGTLTGSVTFSNAAGANLAFTPSTGATLVTRLDGGDATKSAIDNFTLDAGVYA